MQVGSTADKPIFGVFTLVKGNLLVSTDQRKFDLGGVTSISVSRMIRDPPPIPISLTHIPRFTISITRGGFQISFNQGNYLGDLFYRQYCQKLIARSLQLPHIPVTAFSQTDLFLV